MAEGEHQSTAAAAAERVRAILEAAERSAADLEAAARAEAEEIRAGAERDAARVRGVVGGLAERADELEQRLDELTEAVRESAAALKRELDGLRAAAGGGTSAAELDEKVIAEAEAVAARPPDVHADEPRPEAGPELEATSEPQAKPKPRSDRAPEGARLLALKMALDGTPRKDTARYLRENFELDDPEALLDEVYAKAAG